MRDEQHRRKPESGERGSALLIVFVFAAIVAITLYMELPVVDFEAQRQKEQVLVSRGGEYAHAVKLFVRKTGRYPGSIKDLEDTNRMRFLRRRFVDPFTGKDDWRLLHAGPGGTLLDSKVSPVPGLAGAPGQPGAGNGSQPTDNGSSSGFGTPTSTAAFPNNNSNGTGAGDGLGADNPSSFASQTGNADSNATQPSMVVPQPRQRGPAVAANGGGQEPSGNPDASAAPADASPSGNAGVNTSAGSGATPGEAGPANAAGRTRANPGATGAPAQGADPANPGATGAPAQGADPANPQPAVAPGAGTSPGNAGSPDFKGAMLNATNSAVSRQGSSGGGQMGVLQSGGIAGVASKAGGHSIKTVNDQRDYSRWEFYYDPRKDVTPGGVQMGAYAQNGAAGGQGASGGGANTGQGSSGFGQNSGFGQSSGQGSGFGQNSGFGRSSGFGQSSGQGSGFGQNSGFGQSSGTNSSFGNSSGASGQSSGGLGSSFEQNGGTSGANQNPPTNQQPQAPQ